MKNFLYRQGFVLFIVVFFVRSLFGGAAVKGIQAINPELTIQKDLGWVVMLVYAAVAYLLVKWVKVDKEIGLVKPESKKEWYAWAPAYAIPLTLVLFLGFHSSWSHVPFLMIAAIGVAVNEEILFRGILLRALLPFGTAIAIIIPSVLFGASHLGNIIAGGDVTFALFQFIWTTLAGMSFAALRLLGKSLWPSIVYHIVMDGTEYAVTGEFGVHSMHLTPTILTVAVLITAALLIYSVILLMKNKTHVTLGPAKAL
jgi:membrane protease YdiL (CAAX protease family)